MEWQTSGDSAVERIKSWNLGKWCAGAAGRLPAKLWLSTYCSKPIALFVGWWRRRRVHWAGWHCSPGSQDLVAIRNLLMGLSGLAGNSLLLYWNDLLLTGYKKCKLGGLHHQQRTVRSSRTSEFSNCALVWFGMSMLVDWNSLCLPFIVRVFPCLRLVTFEVVCGSRHVAITATKKR